MDGFHEGQRIWVEQADGSQRPGIFVGEAEQASWFGAGPTPTSPTRTPAPVKRSR